MVLLVLVLALRPVYVVCVDVCVSVRLCVSAELLCRLMDESSSDGSFVHRRLLSPLPLCSLCSPARPPSRYFSNVSDTNLYPITDPDNPLRTSTDEEIAAILAAAKARGLKTVLTPMLDPDWTLPACVALGLLARPSPA